MKTKYDVGDIVLIEAKVESIKIENNSVIRYYLQVNDCGHKIGINQTEKLIKGKMEVEE